MHHLKALAFIFFQSTTTNFVVQMNNFISWRILHLKTRLPFTGRPAAPSLAFGRRRTMATSCPADRILVTTALFTGASTMSPRPEPWPSETTAFYGPAPLRQCPKLCAATLLKSSITATPLSCRAFTTPTFITSIPRCTSPLWPSASWAKTRPMPWHGWRPWLPGSPADSWLLTQGWRDYLWNPAGMPSRASLDAAYPTRPVAMYSGDAHTLWLNSCALERLGITEDSESPAGGSYDKDADGHLTGIVREAAAMELMPRIVAEFSREELL